MCGQFEHLLRAQSIGTEIRVHVELTGDAGAFYVRGQTAANFGSLLERLDEVALSRGESTRIIAELLEGL